MIYATASPALCRRAIPKPPHPTPTEQLAIYLLNCARILISLQKKRFMRKGGILYLIQLIQLGHITIQASPRPKAGITRPASIALPAPLIRSSIDRANQDRLMATNKDE